MMAMAVSLMFFCLPKHYSSPTLVGFHKFYSRIILGCHRSFSGLENGGRINGKSNCAPALNCLMVTRCISNVAQMEQSSYIYKGATGVGIQTDRSLNFSSERLDKKGLFRSPRVPREVAL